LRLRPDLPVIMTSGTSEDNPDWIRSIGAAGFLQKPYPPAQLVECLHELIGE
jgi:CheY-like chemotaxis protein